MLRWRRGSQNLADAGCAAADDWEPGTPQPMRKTFKLMVCCLPYRTSSFWRYCRSAVKGYRAASPTVAVERCPTSSHVG